MLRVAISSRIYVGSARSIRLAGLVGCMYFRVVLILPPRGPFSPPRSTQAMNPLQLLLPNIVKSHRTLNSRNNEQSRPSWFSCPLLGHGRMLSTRQQKDITWRLGGAMKRYHPNSTHMSKISVYDVSKPLLIWGSHRKSSSNCSICSGLLFCAFYCNLRSLG